MCLSSLILECWVLQQRKDNHEPFGHSQDYKWQTGGPHILDSEIQLVAVEGEKPEEPSPQPPSKTKTWNKDENKQQPLIIFDTERPAFSHCAIPALPTETNLVKTVQKFTSQWLVISIHLLLYSLHQKIILFIWMNVLFHSS